MEVSVVRTGNSTVEVGRQDGLDVFWVDGADAARAKKMLFKGAIHPPKSLDKKLQYLHLSRVLEGFKQHI